MNAKMKEAEVFSASFLTRYVPVPFVEDHFCDAANCSKEGAGQICEKGERGAASTGSVL